MRRQLKYAIIGCGLCVCLGLAEAGERKITAVRTAVPPVLDGLVDEPQWQAAQAVLDFTQFDPHEGDLPTEITSVRVLYDDHALYIGVICYDSGPEHIVQQLTRRDRSSEADRFTVQIDSYYDRQTAFVFSSNVSGVQSDGFLSQGGTVYDDTWDAVWEVKTRVHMDGWSAEFEIPYSALRFSERDAAEYEWGINFRRYISRKRETVEWVMVPRSEMLLIPKWGHIAGISDIDPPLHLNLLPYVSGKSTLHTSRRADHEAVGGLDLKYGVTRDFTLDATFNPDFGQVEVDRAVLNLTVFETLFPEKRPFFIEGAHLFTFGTSIDNTSLPLFFSRRIGKRPGGLPPADGAIESIPQTTTILGAAKFSGHSASGLSVGLVSAVTDNEYVSIKDSLGARTSVRIEPLASYNVFRAKQDLHGNSWLGGIVTATSRQDSLPALSAGIDWNLRFGGGTYAFDGYVAGARSSMTLRARDGVAARLLFSRIASEHWFYTTSYDLYSRNFNTNDIGFFAQPRDHGGYVQILYRENFATTLFRRYSLAFNPEYRWNWDRVLTHAVVQASLGGEFTNFWSSSFLYAYKPPFHDDTQRGIIGLYKRPAAHSFTFSMQSDERRSLSGLLATGYEFDEKDKTSAYASLSVKVRPVSWMELTPQMFFQRIRKEETGVLDRGAIVTTAVSGSTRSLFGDRDVDEFDVALRGIVTFSRALSLQFYSQVLLARGTYGNYRALISSKAFTAVIDPGTYDFNRVTFNANVLLRWEYLPGSTMYLVWTQARFDDSRMYSTVFGTRFSDAFTLPHEDVLLLKISYWLPL